MARNSSSYRLLVTWDTVRKRQERDDRRWESKGAGLSRRGQSSPDLAIVQSEQGLQTYPDDRVDVQDIYEEEDLEGAVKQLMEKQKFKAAVAAQKTRCKQLENALASDRRPRTLRTAAGEVLQGELPRATGGGTTWLGTSSRFGGFPEDQYIGSRANEISKWVCIDRLDRFKRDRDLRNLPVRQVLKIDNAMDVNRMTGSHLNYITNPLDDKDRGDLEDFENGIGRFALTDEIAPPLPLEASETTSAEEDWEDTPRTRFNTAEMKFQAHLEKLAFHSREEMQKKMGRVEDDWRANIDNRPPTLRCRR